MEAAKDKMSKTVRTLAWVALGAAIVTASGRFSVAWHEMREDAADDREATYEIMQGNFAERAANGEISTDVLGRVVSFGCISTETLPAGPEYSDVVRLLRVSNADVDNSVSMMRSTGNAVPGCNPGEDIFVLGSSIPEGYVLPDGSAVVPRPFSAAVPVPSRLESEAALISSAATASGE
jgi:hypothetical protein